MIFDPFNDDFFKSAFDRFPSILFNPKTSLNNAAVAMPLDVIDTPDKWTVSVDVPGMSKENVKINVKDDMLTISGERKSEYEDKEHHVVEKAYGSFKRQILLPNNVDGEKVDASLDNGILKLEFEKKPEAQAVEQDSGKTIEIN